MEFDRGGEAKPLSVLVADDSAGLRALVRITISSQGWSVIEAENGARALELARSARPDLAILDLDFGDAGPDGVAVCAELKRDPRTASIPTVILTAHDDPEQRARATSAGANAFVGKPFGPLDLTRVLAELVPGAGGTPSLGVLLVDAGAVQPAQLQAALDAQRALAGTGTDRRLGDVLVQRGIVTETAVDRALLEQAQARAAGTSFSNAGRSS
ncbi:MAG TPA: response regulator, partial [Candidatus Limnocylindria bacterium]|nr:response regulator [Candidatus Limnocylindria bacterium]